MVNTHICQPFSPYHTEIFLFNPLSPLVALKHHFTFLKTDLVFLQQRVSERNFHEIIHQYAAIFFDF